MKYIWSADKFFLNFGMIFLTKICSFSGSQRFSESTRDCKFRFHSAFPPWRRKLAENSDGETFISQIVYLKRQPLIEKKRLKYQVEPQSAHC